MLPSEFLALCGRAQRGLRSRSALPSITRSSCSLRTYLLAFVGLEMFEENMGTFTSLRDTMSNGHEESVLLPRHSTHVRSIEAHADID